MYPTPVCWGGGARWDWNQTPAVEHQEWDFLYLETCQEFRNSWTVLCSGKNPPMYIGCPGTGKNHCQAISKEGQASKQACF